jgi:hypothetical protein
MASIDGAARKRLITQTILVAARWVDLFLSPALLGSEESVG